MSDAGRAALADFEAAAEPAERVQVVVNTVKRLQCHDAASQANQVQMVARYSALLALKQHLALPSAAAVRQRAVLPPRPPSADTNAVIDAAHKAVVEKALRTAVKEATAAKKAANARLLGNASLQTWTAVEKYCLAELAALAGPGQLGLGDGTGESDSEGEDGDAEHAARRRSAAKAKGEWCRSTGGSSVLEVYFEQASMRRSASTVCCICTRTTGYAASATPGICI